MKHIRIPVTDRSILARDGEGAWHGYLYLWQGQPNGAVGSRLQWIDETSYPYTRTWEETQGHQGLAQGWEKPLEEDALDILNDHYKVVQAGMPQVKQGRFWVNPASGIRIEKV
jgi:hypothetical protein